MAVNNHLLVRKPRLSVTDRWSLQFPHQLDTVIHSPHFRRLRAVKSIEIMEVDFQGLLHLLNTFFLC